MVAICDGPGEKVAASSPLGGRKSGTLILQGLALRRGADLALHRQMGQKYLYLGRPQSLGWRR